jgi:hypothetical protein
MTTATLVLNRVQKNIQAKIDSVDIEMINWKAVCFAGFFVGLFLLVFYVWQINDLTRGSFLMASYDKQISKLSDENKNLQVSFAESSFLGEALIKIQALNFQKTNPSSVRYIQVNSPAAEVAIKF